MLYAIGGAVLVLILILLWFNISWARNQNERAAPQARAGEESQSSGGGKHLRRDRNDSRAERTEPDTAFREDHRHAGSQAAGREPVHQDKGTASRQEGLSQPGPGVQEMTSDAQPAAASVEVMDAQTGSPVSSVFNKPTYQLNHVTVPEFSEPGWLQSFQFLTDNDKVLGWIAFRDETVGASDQKYDEEFLDVLRNHRQATLKLQKHVGLSHISETSIVGDEGKVWFLTAVDDFWFALFVDRSANGRELTQQLLALQGTPQ